MTDKPVFKITIPPTALEVGAIAVFRTGFDRDPSDDPFDNDRLAFARKYARAAFEAMVEAWPGMHPYHFPDNRGTFPALILPLTEKPDEQ